MLVPVDQANDFQERIASIGPGDRLPLSNFQHQERMATSNPMVQEMERKSAESKSSVPASGRTYVVKAGDTLWSVAKKAGVTPDVLRKLNKLDSGEPLKLGQSLALPGNGKSVSADRTAAAQPAKQTASPYASKTYQPAGSPKSFANSSKTTAPNKISYKVQSGDTLMAIARKYKLNVNDIARWNSLDKNRASLKPGQMLTLYIDQHSKL
jgi:membrane-bound lytic murein transglycosylase D